MLRLGMLGSLSSEVPRSISNGSTDRLSQRKMSDVPQPVSLPPEITPAPCHLDMVFMSPITQHK